MWKGILIGHVGKDPDMRYTPDGLAIANFSVASSKKVKGEDKTEWVKVIAFGKLAEICGQYVVKGKQVYVDGEQQTSEWTDKEGNKRFSVEIIANTVQMLGSKSDNQSQDKPEKPTPTKQDVDDISDNQNNPAEDLDIPF